MAFCSSSHSKSSCEFQEFRKLCVFVVSKGKKNQQNKAKQKKNQLTKSTEKILNIVGWLMVAIQFSLIFDP